MEKLIINVRNQLNTLASVKLKNFSSVIAKNKHQMLGVAIPDLRKLAKQLALSNTEEFLNLNPMQFYEEVMLQGFVIGYSKLNFNVKLEYLKKFIPTISDWSECDCVAATLKFISKNQKESYNFLEPYFSSSSEFEKRFAIVCYMNYFLTDNYIDAVLEKIVNVNSNHYYVNMAVAWALSVCFVKYFNKTYAVFKNCKLNSFTFNKTIQKCQESFRITPEQKEKLKMLKRK